MESYNWWESVLLITGFFTWVYICLKIMGKFLWVVFEKLMESSPDTSDMDDDIEEASQCIYHLDEKRATIRRACDNKILKEKDLIGNDRVHCPNCDKTVLFTFSEAPPCPKCGLKCDAWFSRTEPMGYFCNNCGCER